MAGRRLFGEFLLIEVVTVVILGVVVSGVLSFRWQTLREAHAISALEGQATLVRGELENWRIQHADDDLKKFFDGIGSRTTIVFSLYTRTGDLLATSDFARAPKKPPTDAIESAVTLRRGAESDGTVAGIAVPVTDPRGRVEIIYASAPLNSFGLPRMLGLGASVALMFLVLGSAAIIALAAARVVSRPVDQIRAAASRMAAGGAIERLPMAQARELGEMAEALNEMTAAWDVRLQTALRQRNEQEAVLSSMVEGVLAVDTRQDIISMNQAAAKIVGISPEHAPGQALDEIIRNSSLQQFVARALSASEPLKEEIVLHQRGRMQIIEAHGARLRGPTSSAIGAVVVLNDVTELRRLEQVRRDFVSNVSHELKTPVTSIKGFVETLLDGALETPAQARHFLEIVARQTDRLNAIIEDLLMLSRLEQGEQAAEDMLSFAPLIGPLREAIELCTPSATSRGILIELTCDPDVIARINTNLIQQGVVNLIDNAIKYSEPGTSVSVEAVEMPDEVMIFVRDQGCGIAAHHLPRLFERFYRVDRARSRDVGGTGLGLSIVRHIVQSHHGRVTVDSTPGIGSSFCIHLPKPVNTPALIV